MPRWTKPDHVLSSVFEEPNYGYEDDDAHDFHGSRSCRWTVLRRMKTVVASPLTPKPASLPPIVRRGEPAAVIFWDSKALILAYR
jgi:hypothetical protein